jgi:hypothetical protein
MISPQRHRGHREGLSFAFSGDTEKAKRLFLLTQEKIKRIAGGRKVS